MLSEYPGALLPDAIEAIVWRVPLAQQFALFSACQAHHGIDPSGPTYVDKAMIRAKRRADAEATF